MKTVRERFEEKFTPEPNSGCWLWTASANDAGYGTFGMDGKARKAHRVSYLLYRGPVPKGLFVCHRCDVPCCVNPDHLWLGTNQDNVNDCIAKGRKRPSNRFKTHCVHGHEFSPQNTGRTNRGSYVERVCLACKRNRMAKYNSVGDNN